MSVWNYACGSCGWLCAVAFPQTVNTDFGWVGKALQKALQVLISSKLNIDTRLMSSTGSGSAFCPIIQAANSIFPLLSTNCRYRMSFALWELVHRNLRCPVTLDPTLMLSSFPAASASPVVTAQGVTQGCCRQFLPWWAAPNVTRLKHSEEFCIIAEEKPKLKVNGSIWADQCAGRVSRLQPGAGTSASAGRGTQPCQLGGNTLDQPLHSWQKQQQA